MMTGETMTHATRHDMAGFDGLRRELGRADLGDGVLRDCLREALNALRPSAPDAADALLAGRVAPELRRAVVASLCLPPPAAPMAMPIQMLERERAGRVGRLAARLSGRARQG